MTSPIHPDDLGFFSVLASSVNLTAAARELGCSTAAVSKHLAQMEVRAGVALVNRTTRRMSLTPEGELYVQRARRILGEMDELAQLLGGARAAPTGLLRVNATLGFGRSHVARVISQFVREYADVDVQLQLSVNPPPHSDDAFDVCIRFGEPRDARVIARRIAPNRRLLCASPAYLAGRSMPKSPRDLMQHNCIGIRQGDDRLWSVAPDQRARGGRQDGNGQGPRQSGDQRRGDRRQLGARWSRDFDARAMGYRPVPRQWAAGAGVARVPHAGRGYLCGSIRHIIRCRRGYGCSWNFWRRRWANANCRCTDTVEPPLLLRCGSRSVRCALRGEVVQPAGSKARQAWSEKPARRALVDDQVQRLCRPAYRAHTFFPG